MESPSSRYTRDNLRINLEQCRKLARDVLQGFKAGDSRTLEYIRWNHPRFRRMKDEEIVGQRFVLADAQLVVARLQHVESWPKLLAYIEALRKGDPAVVQFEEAVDAIVRGDIDTLRTMLQESPDLPHRRSTRAHHSTLLHYVSANGVEDNRQKTPPNIVDITRLLLDAGAAVDAESGAYGGGSTTLGLTATSAHPRLAGVQIALMDLLIDRGARIGPIQPGDSMARWALANGCPEAAVHLVERGASADNLYGAAGLGRLDVVRDLFASASRATRESALLIAAQCDRSDVVAVLLERGVDPLANDGMTAMHWAAANGNIPLMESLLSRGAALESLNEFGGTVLSSTLWFAYNANDRDFLARDYPATLRWLIAAGARTDWYAALPAEIEGVYERARRTPAAGG
jgi:ankyrin repeat protein